MESIIPFLDLKRYPESLKEALREKFTSMLDKGLFSGGEEVSLLEANLSEFLNAKNSIACSNGTDALELALRAMDVGVGDEVIVPAISWVSTAEAVCIVGAKPIFVDTDKEGLMDISKVIGLITPQTKAIIPVHLYGKMVNMPALMQIAKKHDIGVVEDAAQAFGSKMEDKAAGTWGDLGCFSFYPSKNLGALGEAGAIICNQPDKEAKIRSLINHGQLVRDEHLMIGRNARIDTVQAGFLNTILPYFEEWQEKRKKLALIYWEQLNSCSWLKLPEKQTQESYNYHLFVVQTIHRDKLKYYLQEAGVQTVIHYPSPIPKIKAYTQVLDYPESVRICNEALSLPLNPWLKTEEINRICNLILKFDI